MIVYRLKVVNYSDFGAMLFEGLFETVIKANAKREELQEKFQLEDPEWFYSYDFRIDPINVE